MELTVLDVVEYLEKRCKDIRALIVYFSEVCGVTISAKDRQLYWNNIPIGQPKWFYYYNEIQICTSKDTPAFLVSTLYGLLEYETREVLKANVRKYLKSSDNKLLLEDKYTAEKAKGGLSSYKAYKPLKKKVEELCLEILSKKPNATALQLVKHVSKIIESEYKNLLENFAPYQNYKNDGTDWTNKTFYNWCNNIKKSYKHK